MNNFINPNLPTGQVEGAWQKSVKNLSNLTSEKKNKFEIIIVGCGLSGSSAAATLAEEGFKIKLITYHDSPRRAHSVSVSTSTPTQAHDGWWQIFSPDLRCQPPNREEGGRFGTSLSLLRATLIHRHA